MTYDLINGLDRERFKARVNKLYKDGAAVELTEKRQRSLNQNSYLHVIVGITAMETGCTLEYAKDIYYKRLVNADLFVVEKEDRYAGKVSALRSSADLTKEEMSMSIDRFKRWAAENGIYLPEPGDDDALHLAEVEMGRMRQYL